MTTKTTRRRFLQGAAALIGLAAVEPAQAIERFYSIPNEVALRNLAPPAPIVTQLNGGRPIEHVAIGEQGFHLGSETGHLRLADISVEALREAERNLFPHLDPRSGYRIRFRPQGGEFTDWQELVPTEDLGQYAIAETVQLEAGVHYEMQVWRALATSPHLLDRASYRWHDRVDYQRETHGPPWQARADEPNAAPMASAGNLHQFFGEAVDEGELRFEL